MRIQRKSVEALTQEAFYAGVKAAVGFPAMDAIPDRHLENAYQRFKDEWTGRPETPEPPPTLSARDSFSAHMGHPGGHYG